MYERDASLAKEAGVDILFMPTPEEMYPQDGGIRILPGLSRKFYAEHLVPVILMVF